MGRPGRAIARSIRSLGKDDGLTLFTMEGKVTAAWEDEDAPTGTLLMDTDDAVVDDRMVDDSVVAVLIGGFVVVFEVEGRRGVGTLGVESNAVAVR